MFSKTLVLALTFAYAQARFGQEQIPIPAISAVTSGGGPGVAATIAGGAISTLLGAANPCLKLQTADNIITQLGNGADSIAAAIGLVKAEQNFNNFTSDRPVFCNDPTLPKTVLLRGILPLVDPAVIGADKANQLSDQSATKPFAANGLSVAEVFAAQGFTLFNTKNLAGAVGPTGAELAASGGGGGGGDNADDEEEVEPPTATETAPTKIETEAPVETTAPADCPPDVTVTVTVTGDAPDATEAPDAEAPDAGDDEEDDGGAVDEPPATGGGNGSTVGGLDFGKCSPAIKFVGGLGNRPATEFTFQAIDPLVALGQQEALNPAIIVNRVCDQLTNVCGANQAAKDACLKAKANVDSTQRNAATAIKFNTELGFADAFSEADAAAPVDTVDQNPNVEKSSVAGVDFGKCVPTMKFVGGLGNRPATEFTFQAIDPIVALGQQEALNPAIIVNRICDQLTNVCGANQAAKDLCLKAKANVDSTQRNAATAVKFNTELGFAGADVSRRSLVDAQRKRVVEGVKRRSARV